MAIASIVVASLLQTFALLVDRSFDTAGKTPLNDVNLSVRIERSGTADPPTVENDNTDVSVSNTEREPGDSPPVPTTVRVQQQETAAPSEPTVHQSPPQDWQQLIKTSVDQSVSERYERESQRELMWRKTGSIMFEPGDEPEFEDSPILADLRFRQKPGVVGLGITIGSCFIGVPLAGVPVEERTVPISLFVCRGGT